VPRLVAAQLLSFTDRLALRLKPSGYAFEFRRAVDRIRSRWLPLVNVTLALLLLGAIAPRFWSSQAIPHRAH
jgi:hypothetical protein